MNSAQPSWLETEVKRLKEPWGHVVLLDAHSIRSRIARLFDGELPHLNLGTYDGRSAAPSLILQVVQICALSVFSYIVDGRSKRGWTTRQYGQPTQGLQAIQLELAQRSYLSERSDREPPQYDPARARALQCLLQDLVQNSLEWKSESGYDAPR